VPLIIGPQLNHAHLGHGFQELETRLVGGLIGVVAASGAGFDLRCGQPGVKLLQCQLCNVVLPGIRLFGVPHDTQRIIQRCLTTKRRLGYDFARQFGDSFVHGLRAVAPPPVFPTIIYSSSASDSAERRP
jgi:hypothetical protein